MFEGWAILRGNNQKLMTGVSVLVTRNTPFPVRKPTTERLALFYHIKGYCGRLTMVQKVSLPLCKTCYLPHALPRRYPHHGSISCQKEKSVWLCIFARAIRDLPQVPRLSHRQKLPVNMEKSKD